MTIKILTRITMYRLMLYFLFTIFTTNIFLSTIKILTLNPLDILLGGMYLVAACNLVNYFLSKIFRAKTNLESSTITALILSLIIGPYPFFENILILTFISITAMASKYLFAINKKHIFNPAAFAVLISALIFKEGATWWIGNIYTLPIIFIGGILVLAKTRKFGQVLSFLGIYFLTLFVVSQGVKISVFLTPAIWFFTFIMLVEPLTSPVARNPQIFFGAVTASSYFLIPKIIPGFTYSLEASLLTANLFSFLAYPAFNQILTLKRKQKNTKDIWSFYFEPMSKFKFMPGQYLEWTYSHKNPDSRGFRRYFTISSSPEEKYVILTTKLSQNPSSFKKALIKMNAGEQITASRPQGEFILPKAKETPLAFIAGGIGVTPFRSMVKNLLEKNEKRDVTLFYSNKTSKDVAFKDLFDHAQNIGVKTIYIETQKDGYINEKMIKEKLPDYQKRVFYVSGPEPMVESFKKMLLKMKVKSIKTDFFPGYTERY